MRNRLFLCLFTILAAAGPYGLAQVKKPMLISSQELGRLPFEKRAYYVAELLKFMKHLEEYQRKNGLDYAHYFNFLIPVAEAQNVRKCFYGLHIRNSVNGYCHHDKRSGDRDLTENVDCKEPVRIIDRRTNTYKLFQAVMECPKIFAVDGSAGCTKLDDGASEGCINNLRGDNPNEPLEKSEKFIKLVNKLGRCGKENLDYCNEWNEYQTGFDSICPGATRGVIALCKEISPFFSELRKQVGLSHQLEKPAPRQEVVVTATAAVRSPTVLDSVTIKATPPGSTASATFQPPAAESVTVLATPPQAEPVTVLASPPPSQVVKVEAEPPKPQKSAEIKPAGAKNKHSCAERAGGYPKYANNFACLICPIEKHLEADNPDYKVSDRYLALISVVQGRSCGNARVTKEPLPQRTLELINRFGYCSDSVYKWESKPSSTVQKWLTRSRTRDPSYRSLFAARDERWRARKAQTKYEKEANAAEKAFKEAFGLDILTATDLFCASDNQTFQEILAESANTNGGPTNMLISCLQEANQKAKQKKGGCYNFEHWGNPAEFKYPTQMINSFMKQKFIMRVEYNCGAHVKDEDHDKCEVLEESGESDMSVVQPSQANAYGGYLKETSETKAFVADQMRGKSRSCMYKYAEFSKSSCGPSNSVSVQVDPSLQHVNPQLQQSRPQQSAEKVSP